MDLNRLRILTDSAVKCNYMKKILQYLFEHKTLIRDRQRSTGEYW